MEFGEYYQNRTIVEEYDYKRSRGLKGKLMRDLEAEAVDQLTGEPNDKNKILEIGVGTGFISKIIFKKGKFNGMDISESMLHVARKNLQQSGIKEKDFFVGDILKPKIIKKFDIVVTIRVLSHFQKKEILLALVNINKILKENGALIFNLENRSLIRRLLRKITLWGSTENYQYSVDEINKLCNKSGFKIKKIYYVDHFFFLPLHVINKILRGQLDKKIICLENKMKNFRFMSNNSFIKCQKK